MTPKDLNRPDTPTNTPTKGETLDLALRRVWAARWQYQKGSKSTLSQAQLAVRALWLADPSVAGEMTVEEAQAHLQFITARWYSEGLSPATINKRLNCLSALGVKVQGYRMPKDRKPKWWLSEVERDRAFMKADISQDFVDYIKWTMLTGLRVMESLALEWRDVDWSSRSITVSGTKTATAQATLPLSAAALAILIYREATGEPRPFATTYETLEGAWRALRRDMGWPPSATLKALRRSAARYLHVDCGMPLHMVQQYLRHESLNTTLEYLRLTGGYGTEEMRRYLK